MRSTDLHAELSQEALDAAHLAFCEFLRRKKGLPREFIERHSADLLAQARLELSRHLAEGEEVRSPVGFILTCAERRAKNLREQEARAPRITWLDPEVPLADGAAVSPERETLKEDRYRQVQAAVDRLRPDERRVIGLIYFKGLSL